MKILSDLFEELRALKVRKVDDYRTSYPITYGEIYNSYQFIKFEKNEENYIPIDLLRNALLEDARVSSKEYIKKRTGGDRQKHFYNDSNEARKKDYINRLTNQFERNKLYINMHVFQKPIKGSIKKEFLQALKEKENIYNKLLFHYDEVKKQNKNIFLLPMRLSLIYNDLSENLNNEKVINYIDMKELIKYLNDAFHSLIKRIQKRVAYRCFIAYDRVILIDKKLVPYLHVNFYLNELDINNYYIKNITREWCSIIDDVARINYVYFNNPLQESIDENDEEDEDWNKNIVYRNKKEYRFTLKICNSIRPFCEDNELSHDELIKKIRKEIVRSKKGMNDFRLNELIKKIEKIKINKAYHKDYLLCISKQYVKIPGLNNFTKGKIIYQGDLNKK